MTPLVPPVHLSVASSWRPFLRTKLQDVRTEESETHTSCMSLALPAELLLEGRQSLLGSRLPSGCAHWAKCYFLNYLIIVCWFWQLPISHY